MNDVRRLFIASLRGILFPFRPARFTIRWNGVVSQRNAANAPSRVRVEGRGEEGKAEKELETHGVRQGD